MKAKIGLGIITYNRPAYFKRAIKSVLTHLDMLDELVVVDDGSSTDYVSAWSDKAHIIRQPNGGVAKAKNAAMRYLLDKDCAFLFIAEDDIEVLSRNAVVWYLAAYKATGVNHMMFAHHGPGNEGQLLALMGLVAWYPSCVGAWCFYTREILEQIGLMDEHFYNAWEHVEHSWRIMRHNKVDYGYYPDVVDSQEALKEQSDAIENSVIGAQDNPERIRIIIEGLEYWKNKEKTFPAQHTLDYYTQFLQSMEER